MTSETNDLELGDDLRIRKTARRAAAGGTWVCGTIAGHRFDALVFPEHAENAEWEIGDSRVSKLWIARPWSHGHTTVFHWDRGADVPAADPVAAASEFPRCDCDRYLISDGLSAFECRDGR